MSDPIKALPLSIRLAELYDRLETQDGLRMVSDLRRRLEPYLPEGRMLEPFGAWDQPDDSFERSVFESLREQFINPHEAGRYLPAVVLSTLAHVADQAGIIDSDRAEAALGPGGVQFLQRLYAISPDSPRDPLADRVLLDRLTAHDRTEVIERLGLDSPRLEALEVMRAALVRQGELAGLELFAVQHLFQSTESLFDAFFDSGIAYEDMVALGKVYSTNRVTAASLDDKGVEIPATSMALRAAVLEAAESELGPTEFKRAMKKVIRARLKQLIATLPHPPDPNASPSVLLIDDGGLAVEMLHEPEFIDWAPYFACVEQTTQGARIVRRLEREGKLRCAVANVAECWAKLDFESPMIGHSVGMEIERKIAELEAYGVQRPKEATVIGYGPVGRAVARELRAQGYIVHVHDEKSGRLLDAQADGFVTHADKADALGCGGVMVSCAGEQTVSAEEARFLPDGAIMFNAASGDGDIDTQRLLRDAQPVRMDGDGVSWGSFQGQLVCLDHSDAEAHSDAVIQLDGKQVYLANNGYVINMTGERDPIPPRYIQLTRTLLFMGALVARRAEGPGVFDIPDDWQRAVVNLVQRILARSGEDLLSPSWERYDGKPEPMVREIPWELVKEEMPEVARRIAEVRGWRAEPEDGPVWPREIGEVGGFGKATGRLPVGGPPPRAPSESSSQGPWPEGTVYGYELGAVAPASLGELIDGLIGDNDQRLTAEEAALHRAVFDANRCLDASLRASFDGTSPVFDSRRSQRFVDGATIQSGRPLDEHERFELAYGHYLVALLTVHLRRDGDTPRREQLATAIADIFRSSKVPVGRWLDWLEASDREDDRALAIAVRERI